MASAICRFKHLMTVALVALFSLASAGVAYADPPPWAPAWGYRAKHGKHLRYAHVDAARGYAVPLGIATGTCDRGPIDAQTAGVLIGGVAGGVIGSNIGKGDGRIAATIGGTLLGALIGSEIGASMDLADHYCVAETLEYGETNSAVHWRNPDLDAQYEVRPTRTYQRDDGRYCREFQTTVTIGGRFEEAYGTACRQPDGTWQRVG